MAGYAALFETLENSKPIKLDLGRDIQVLNPNDNPLQNEPFDPKANFDTTTNYATEIHFEQEKIMKENALSIAVDIDTMSVCTENMTLDSTRADDLTSVGAAYENNDEDDDIYDRFNWTKKSNQILPIDAQMHQILDMVSKSKYSIIFGPTGCGKTTQVPLAILETFKTKKKHCQIIVTQPRRIAAVSVCDRVCTERGWKLGELVGYQIGQERIAGPYTKLLYCTTGVLLQRLVNQKTLDGITYIILDEIHERDKDMDFLMIVIKILMEKNPNSRTHIILMSATMDVETFSQYFANYDLTGTIKIPAKHIEITSKKMYPIYKFYLDELAAISHTLYRKIPRFSLSKPQIVPEQYIFATKVVLTFDDIDVGAIGGTPNQSRGAVLIFLPGIHEITEMHTALETEITTQKISCKKDMKWEIVILHSTIPKEQQDLVFRTVPHNVRKIILSTNIAESSITVPDTKYVIDFCLTKVMTVSQDSNYSSLQLEWASYNSSTQRAGRVGRVSEGRVYYMITKEFYKNLPVSDTPVILRSPLDTLVLNAKLLNMGPPLDIFGRALDPPQLGNIKKTILTLKEIGALYPMADEEYTDTDGDVTYLGEVIATLPVDPRVGKLIFLGHIYNILEDCIIMAAAMSVKNPFSSPYREELKAYSSKLIWADSACSDLIAFLNVYKVWRDQKLRGVFHNRKGASSEKVWAKKNFVQIMSLREIEKLVTDLTRRLEQKDICINPNIKIDRTKRAIFLKIVIGGAFYPNYFFHGKDCGHSDEKQAVRDLNGNSPYNTVYLQGLPPSHTELIPFYAHEIKNQLRLTSPGEMKISACGSKVFIQFKNSSHSKTENGHSDFIPGNVNVAVFKAVKLRMLNNQVKFHGYNYEDHRVQKLSELTEIRRRIEEKKSVLSEKTNNSRFINIRITHVESISNFWVQDADKYVTLRQIDECLNHPKNHLIDLTGLPVVRKVYAVPFNDGDSTRFYRAKVLVVNSKKTHCKVRFIDYGNDEENVPVNLFKQFGESIEEMASWKPAAFECSLAEVYPSLMSNYHGVWSQEAIKWFASNYLNQPRPIGAEIYSIVDDVVRLIIFDGDRRNEATVNKKLVDLEYAVYGEEPYNSKLDHVTRLRNLACTSITNIGDEDDEEDFFESSRDTEEHSANICLKGPFSPLETKLVSRNRSINSLPVHIDRDSVNCVFLDTNSEDPHDRVMVAAFVGTTPNGDVLKIKETTLMPNIPGFTSLLCLTFAPQVELRANPERNKVIGAICGLGFKLNENGRFESLYPENDIEISFDFEVKNKYLTQINALRLSLNIALTDKTADINIIRQTAQDYSLRLLKYPHVKIENEYFKNSYQWGQIHSNHLLNPAKDSELSHPCQPEMYVYHLIWGILLSTKVEIDYDILENNLRELKRMADGDLQFKAAYCQLCKVYLDDFLKLRVHLITRRHDQHVSWCKELKNTKKNDCPQHEQHIVESTRYPFGSYSKNTTRGGSQPSSSIRARPHYYKGQRGYTTDNGMKYSHQKSYK